VDCNKTTHPQVAKRFHRLRITAAVSLPDIVLCTNHDRGVELTCWQRTSFIGATCMRVASERQIDHVEKISRATANNVRRLAGNLFSVSATTFHLDIVPSHAYNRISAQFGRSPTLFSSTTFIHRAASSQDPPQRRCSIKLTLSPGGRLSRELSPIIRRVNIGTGVW